MATTTCFLWFCQEMNERSLHLQRDTSQQGTIHFPASESLLNDRRFTLGHSQSKPLWQEIWSLVRKGSIPLKERFQILRCLKCLKRGSKFQQFQGSTASKKNHHEVKCDTSLGCTQFCCWEAVLLQHLHSSTNSHTNSNGWWTVHFKDLCGKDLGNLNIAGDTLEPKDN